MTSRSLVAAAAAAALVATLATASYAQEKFPSKPISMVTHAGPGGGTDITTRMMMVAAAKPIGQELTVVSKSGGSGTVSLQYAMSQPKDGHTVLTITQSHIFQILQGKVPLTIDDLVGVARATLDPQVIAVKADSPIKDLKDLVAASKAKQGGLKWGTTFVGGIDHVAIHNFTKAAGAIPYAVVAFRGGGDIVTNLVGGNLDVALINYAEGEAQFKSKQIRAIAVLDEKRIDSIKDVPTAIEQGIRNTAYTVRGFAVLKGTPEDRIAHLEKGMVAAMKHPVYEAYLTQGGMPLTSVAGSAEWTKMIREIAVESRTALTELGILKK
jgi:tripartite-type tricarboxylate transporter receptor subunit TctC